MTYVILGFATGISLILAIGVQNIFVIEQGLKKEFVFLVCLICSISDFLLIFLGVFVFHYFQSFFTPVVELILNILLLIFLIHFIWIKFRTPISNLELNFNKKKYSFLTVLTRTIGFTYFNPHVYSDTVFFLGNFSKNFLLHQKVFFGIGASISSFIFFFILGYMSKYLSSFFKTKKVWKIINTMIIIFMSFLTFYVLMNIIDFYS